MSGFGVSTSSPAIAWRGRRDSDPLDYEWIQKTLGAPNPAHVTNNKN
jgi:hypothetical protein